MAYVVLFKMSATRLISVKPPSPSTTPAALTKENKAVLLTGRRSRVSTRSYASSTALAFSSIVCGVNSRRALEGIGFLFNRVICDEKVPIIAVLTGLEHAEPLEEKAVEAKRHFEASGMRPKELCCVVSIRGKRNEFDELYKRSQEKLRHLVADSCSRQKWSTGTDDWFGRIYQNVYSTGLCFLPKVQLQFVTAVGNVVDQFIQESDMEPDEARRLKDTLLRAEKKFLKKKRSLW